jgi:hypothetical protein
MHALIKLKYKRWIRLISNMGMQGWFKECGEKIRYEYMTQPSLCKATWSPIFDF